MYTYYISRKNCALPYAGRVCLNFAKPNRILPDLKLSMQKTQKHLEDIVLKDNIIISTGLNVHADKLVEEETKVLELSKLQSSFQLNVKKIIEELAGAPQIIQTDFHNWAHTQYAKQIWAAHPRNLKEIQRLVKVCNKYEVKIRCVGAGHSWAPIFPDYDSIFVYMDQLDIKPNIKFSDAKKETVDISPGATSGDFKKFQLENKVNLPCNVILDNVQMVSVVATGCHGVGKECFTPGDYVEKMQIVNSSGDLVTYTKAKDEDMMKAVSASFGLFGIIYEMTIRVERQAKVETKNLYLPVKDFFYTNTSALKKLVNDNWSVELFWFPYGSNDMLRRHDDVMKEEIYARVINKKEESNLHTKDKIFYEKQNKKDEWSAYLQQTTNKYVVDHPSLTPYFGHVAAKTIKRFIYPAGTVYQELPHAVHFRKHVSMNPVYDLEFAFAIENDNFDRVLKIIQVVFDKMKRSRKYPLNIAMEMRFMKYSTSYLCPAKIGDPSIGGTGQVFYIEILSAVNTEGWGQFSVDVASEWFQLGGIPHLAKEWPVTANNYSYVRKALKKPIEDFIKMLDKSKADPKRIFFNAHLYELLYDYEIEH